MLGWLIAASVLAVHLCTAPPEIGRQYKVLTDGSYIVDGVLRIPFDESLAASPDRQSAQLTAARAFLVGPENDVVRVAIDAALNGDLSLSPYVFHGPTGVGKSHLVRGLAAAFAARHSPSSVAIVSGRDLAHDRGLLATEAAPSDRDDATPADSTELVVIEDIDELRNRIVAQQRLTHLLDVVSKRSGIVVLTSRVALARLLELSATLRSRLMAGLVVAIALPEVPTREALLREFAADLPVSITKEAIQLLAAEVAESPSALRGALQTLSVRPTALPGLIDGRDVQDFLRSLAPAKPIGMRAVALQTARYFGVTVPEMKSSSRARNHVDARAVAIFLVRQLTCKSLGEIGAYFGSRDHTTILHNCRRTESLLKRDTAIQTAVATLRGHLAAPPRRPERARAVEPLSYSPS